MRHVPIKIKSGRRDVHLGSEGLIQERRVGGGDFRYCELVYRNKSMSQVLRSVL